MKEYEVGMVLGKFYPPHKGHLHLIDTAISKCSIVYVLCCSIKSEKIKGSDRWLWLTMIYASNKNVKVIHVDEELPQYPEEHEQFWAIWHKTVYDNVPTQLEAIFTSEEYGELFAKVLGCKHELVDLPRSTIPISGTQVRENPLKNWDLIPNEVRGHFTKKIVVVGPESTGKSTLTRNLSAYFDGDLVIEYGRTYTQDMADLFEMKKVDFDRIAFGHMVDVNKRDYINPKKLRFVDTEAITTKVFGGLYLGDDFQSNEIDGIIAKQHFDMWFLMDIDVPYINDGNRLPESYRKNHFDRIKSELDKNKIKYTILNGGFDERYEKAKNLVSNLLF